MADQSFRVLFDRKRRHIGIRIFTRIIYYLISGYPDSKLSVLSIPTSHVVDAAWLTDVASDLAETWLSVLHHHQLRHLLDWDVVVPAAELESVALLPVDAWCNDVCTIAARCPTTRSSYSPFGHVTVQNNSVPTCVIVLAGIHEQNLLHEYLLILSPATTWRHLLPSSWTTPGVLCCCRPSASEQWNSTVRTTEFACRSYTSASPEAHMSLSGVSNGMKPEFVEHLAGTTCRRP